MTKRASTIIGVALGAILALMLVGCSFRLEMSLVPESDPQTTSAHTE